MPNSEPTIHDVLEAVSAFAESVESRFNEIDNRFEKVDGRFAEMSDRFTQLERKMDDGFVSVRSEIHELREELVERIERLEKRTAEDTDATMKDYLDLKKRVDVLEQRFQQMQLAHG